jgi:hypothetical protein
MIMKPHEARRRLARLQATDPLIVAVPRTVFGVSRSASRAAMRATHRAFRLAPHLSLGVLL